ncbi:hypothetical protein H072_6733 [Dactylellina haptotyla CBS 200.50]|uniref:tyrosinase n=1 Tax=Dactylellina haptotyla (strain CBS 200.50) TaxID=1284197 RepID=S8BJJ0_DACHA|nr:hypothetical protein H072_6733 [Dactylellina haptotyla CBS 200.50]
MAVWSSLKYAVAATCIMSMTQVEAMPAATSSGGIVDLMSSPQGLFRRQNAVITTGVQEGFGPAKGQVPVRKEIRDLIQNTAEFNLYLLALQRFYAKPQKEDTSFFGIAKIHGRPFGAWNGVTSNKGDKDVGYCTHKDVLFLTWHRPYLALFEQMVWENARDVVNEFPAAKRAAYQAVLPTLRIPYWDWASNSSIPREVGDMPKIEVDTPKGRQTIDNPLYSYKFTDISGFKDIVGPLANATETVRYPQLVDGKYVSQYDPLNRVMENAIGGLKNRVYRILTVYKDLNAISTGQYNRWTHKPADSLEGVHDDIHNAIGGPVGGPSGTMTDLSMASYDPIFWLHHTNVDRLFALWQGINPSTYDLSGTSSFGTYTIVPGSKEDLNTQLGPFRQTGNTFHTSATSQYTKTFGYTYPETIDWDLSTPEAIQNRTIAAVNRLYGEETPAGALAATLLITTPKGTHFNVNNSPLNTPPSASSLFPYKQSIVEAGKYNEWSADILVNQAALGGDFKLYFFFGEASADQTEWELSQNLVGTYSVLTSTGMVHNQLVQGVIPLTSALLNKVVMEQIKNLRREVVAPYLIQNLKVKVLNTATGKLVDLKTITDLKITISSAAVTLPKTESEIPQWGASETAVDFIDVPKGLTSPVQH